MGLSVELWATLPLRVALALALALRPPSLFIHPLPVAIPERHVLLVGTTSATQTPITGGCETSCCPLRSFGFSQA